MAETVGNAVVPVATVALYLGGVFGLHRWMATREELSLRKALFAHNAMLSIGSALLLYRMVETLAVMFRETSVFDVLCDPTGKFLGGPIYAAYYINYCFKYYELLDTLFLVLRKREIGFLHVYHHAITLLLCWSQIRGQSCVQWVPITINLAVHVVMYGYFALASIGYKPSWGRHMTKAQILQFVVALIFCYALFFMRVVKSLGYSSVPQCQGEWGASIFGLFVLTSFLCLFLRYYWRRLRAAAAAAVTTKSCNPTAFAAAAHAVTNAVLNTSGSPTNGQLLPPLKTE